MSVGKRSLSNFAHFESSVVYFFLRFYDFDQIAGQSALYKAHAAVGEIIVRYNGTLERYAGDGIMIIFNDPIPVSNPALQAVQMALEMRKAIDVLT